MSNSIKVVARFRPQNRIEVELGGLPIVDFESADTCKLDVGFSLMAALHLLNTVHSLKRHLAPLPSTAFLI